MLRLAIQDLTKEYPTRGEPLVVLREVSLQLGDRESLAVVGPSGSGKTTLLSILGTLEPPTKGRVLYAGTDPFALSERELAAFRSHSVGFVFQEHHLLPQCTVLENVLVPTIALGTTSAEQLARARDLLERVGLGERLEHRPAELSGGERQRAALARALINRPAVLLADEPTGNLDRSTADRVADLMLKLQAEEASILIVVTHSQRLAERMGRQMELDEGRLQEMHRTRVQ